MAISTIHVDEPVADHEPGARSTIVADLFPDPAPVRPITIRALAITAAAIVVGTIISLLRTTGTGPLQSIWQEDAKNLLNDAYNMTGLSAIFKPVNGYMVIGPRLFTELATLFPVRYAAAVLSVSAAVITAALVVQVYVASGAHLRSRLLRVAVAAPMLFAAVAENNMSEIYNRPVCLHFFTAYAMFWVLLWTPASRLGKVGAVATVAFAASASVICIAFIPLAALRMYQRRTGFSLLMLAALVACAAVNLGAPLLGFNLGPRPGHITANPVPALANFVVWAVPQSLLGFRATHLLPGYPTVVRTGAQVGLIVTAWAIVAAVVTVAVVGGRRGWLRPRWTLSGLAALHALGFFCFLVMANGSIQQRYLYAAELLIFAALLVLLEPRQLAGRLSLARLAPLGAVALLTVAIGAVNFRFDNTFRGHAPVWTQQVAAGTRLCRADPNLGHVNLRGAPQPWASIVSVPCSLLRGGKSISCDPPECQWVEPPATPRPTPSK